MSSSSNACATAPGYSELMSRVTALAPLIAREADAAERLRHLSDEGYHAMHAAGLWHMLTPRALGGSELPYSDALAVAEAVSRIDGSSGWCLMVAGVQHGGCGSLIVDAGCREVFATGLDTNIAGQGIPRGIAREADGGFHIRGDWSYGSGIFHANWIHSGCVLMANGAPKLDDHGHPIVIITYVPRSAVELKDNWDVLGLRGTGSFDYSLAQEAFIPAHLAYVYSKNTVERGGYQYSLGIVGLTAWGHTSFALGVGRHALDELKALAGGKAGPFGVLADSASFQEKFARAEAQYRSTRAFVYSAWNDVDATLARAEPVSNEQIALVKLAFRYAHEVMSQICTFAYNFGGGVALRPSALQRCYRDLHAGLQHVLLSDQILQDCGKVLLGHVQAGQRFNLLGLS
jgi:alkylation response protein AidB-like acyl-CoA dehydrogenase